MCGSFTRGSTAPRTASSSSSGSSRTPPCATAAAELLGGWSVAAPYAPIATAYQKVSPVNLKMETPDKQNATFDAALAFAMSDADPDYPAMVLANYMFGGSITGRAPNRIRNQEGLSYGVNSRLSAPALGERGELRRHGDRQPPEHAESGSQLPRRAGENAGRRVRRRGGRRGEETRCAISERSDARRTPSCSTSLRPERSSDARWHGTRRWTRSSKR